MSPIAKRFRDDDAIAQRDACFDWTALEELTHRDSGDRGLAGYRPSGDWLDRGQLRGAALELARHAQAVGIVTGFCATDGDRVTAETDGPPGALLLAHVLRSLSIDVTLITDRYALPLVDRGRDLSQLDSALVVEYPFEDGAADCAARTRHDAPHNVATDRFIDEFLSRGAGRDLTHLVAIERPGPSHTLESLISQQRGGDAPANDFQSRVPRDDRDVCHDMRGGAISGHTAKTHRLFEVLAQRKLPITTIGIGDGGNEIGMGRFAWENLAAAIGSDVGSRIACRVATDFALIAGTSNWGAYALSLAAAHLRGKPVVNRWLRPEGQRALIEAMVADAGAVDGRTLRSEATVDGLSLDSFLRPLAEMHAIFERASADR